jgi:DNA mismatch endonuclease (patch repair protein)
MAKDKKEHVYTPRDPAVVSFTMSHIRGKDTGIELKLRKALYEKGFRYRCNSSRVFGHPDIVSQKHKLAIFCDSEFFHGKDWDELKLRLENGNNSVYWVRKITRNMERDRENERDLASREWTVLRFWGKDILKHTGDCIRAVEETIFEKRVDAAAALQAEDLSGM